MAPPPDRALYRRGLAGIVVSIIGNETAQRWGRGRVVTVAMSTAAVLSMVTGWSASAAAVLAGLLVVLWNAAIYFDSSALTAGTVQAADKELRGATMGPHSICGYAGGFIGPRRRAGARLGGRCSGLGSCLRPSSLDYTDGPILLASLRRKKHAAGLGCHAG
jgi:predicted MFS family arabinose efflux permease